MPYPSKKFRQNPFTTFSVIRRTDKQTDRHWIIEKVIISFFGGCNYNNKKMSNDIGAVTDPKKRYINSLLELLLKGGGIPATAELLTHSIRRGERKRTAIRS